MGLDAGQCSVQGQLAHRDAHPTCTQVTQTQNPLAVRHHNRPHIGLRPKQQQHCLFDHPSPDGGSLVISDIWKLSTHVNLIWVFILEHLLRSREKNQGLSCLTILGKDSNEVIKANFISWNNKFSMQKWKITLRFSFPRLRITALACITEKGLLYCLLLSNISNITKLPMSHFRLINWKRGRQSHKLPAYLS